MYPFVYLLLTLPIAIGRMIAMTGKTLPETFFVVAGVLLTSCGWIDALLYTLTRRILVNNEISTGQYNRTVNATLTNAARPGDEQNYGLTSMTSKEPISSTVRTVTIVGGSNRLSRIVDQRRGRHLTRSRHHDSIAESPTRSGSQDSIIKAAHPDGINIVTETNIQVEDVSEEHDITSGLRPRSDTGYSRHP
jgi:hypothetical protein